MKRLTTAFLKIFLFATFAAALPGELDLTFNGTGISRLTFDEGDDRALATTVQSDGKIVAAGRVYNGQDYDFGLARYNPDGSLDASFDADGLVNTPISGDDQASTVVIQPDGKIVAAGFTSDGAIRRFAVVRYHPDGSLDASFDADGIVTTAISAADNETARAIALQPDGKILAAGSSGAETAVARYNDDGSLDASFDGDGIVTTSVSASSDVATAVVFDSFGADQKIVVAGYTFNPNGAGTGFDIAVLRYNADGSPDATFDGDGIVTTSIGNDADFAHAALIQPTDGKIVVAGSTRGGARAFAAARYNDDGSLDASFDADGIVVAPLQTGDAQARAVGFQTGGRIVLAGHASRSSEQDLADDFALAALNADGSPDASFDGDGRVVTPWQFNSSTARALAVQTDGKLVVVGGASNGSNSDVAVVRFLRDGSLDTSFNGTGKVRTDFGFNETAFAVEIQTDGKIVVAGENNEDFLVVRYLPDGALDTTFNGVGYVFTSLSPRRDAATAVKIQPDGRIVVGGLAIPTVNNFDFALVRYFPDGALDTSFDGDGRVVTPVGPSTDVVNSVAIQPDGKIVAAGYSFTNFANFDDFALVRYNANGSLDASFDADGKVTTNFPSVFASSADQARAAALQPDGKIVVVGQTSAGMLNKFAAVRYLPNGAPDNAFGAGGLVTTAVGEGESGAFTIALQPNGKIYAGGYARIGAGDAFAVVRYNADGTPDAPFADRDAGAWGSGGAVLVDISTGDDRVYGLQLDAQGRVVVAGEANDTFGVIRLQGDLAPTAAAVSIAGRVLTQGGAGLRNAVVYLTESTGVTRTAHTGSFGFYRFEDVAAGQTVVIGVAAKRFTFEPRVLTLTDDVAGADFRPVGAARR